MTPLHFIISFILAYILGSLPFGYWIGMIFYHKNVLTEGSGNIGMTNSFRVLGPVAGIAVLLLDLLKGTAGAFLALIWGGQPTKEWIFFVGIGAIIGHTFSFWIKFKGGKAVATSAGVLLAYSHFFFLLAVIVLVSMIILTSMVSVGSMLGFTAVTIGAAIAQDWLLTVIALILTIFVFYRHRENIKRIFNGTESLVPFGIYYWIRHNK